VLEGVQIEQDILNVKRLTSGFLVSNGFFCLNENVCDKFNQRELECQEKEMARVCKAWVELKKQIAAVKKIWLEKGDNIQTWNAKECKLFLQYRKIEGDVAMPTKINELRAHCALIAHHHSLVPLTHSSEDEGDDEGHSDDCPDNAPL